MLISGYNFPNFVIKFGKKENLEKLQSGSIYMKDTTKRREMSTLPHTKEKEKNPLHQALLSAMIGGRHFTHKEVRV